MSPLKTLDHCDIGSKLLLRAAELGQCEIILLYYYFCALTSSLGDGDVVCGVGKAFAFPPISDTMMPRIQAFVRKNDWLAIHSPGTKVLLPRNSRSNPCWSHMACVKTHRTSAIIPSRGDATRDDVGR
jgi:hypothetical protein